MNFHEKTIDRLVTRLFMTKKYDFIEKNIVYSFSEIDVLAHRHKGKRTYLLAFEVKSNDKDNYWKKAIHQLFTHEDTFGKTVDKMYKFYVCPKNKDKKEYTVSWVK